MPVTIPVTNERAFFRQTTQLDGVDYILRFQFNQRLCRWYLHVFDADDVPIMVGIRLAANFPLGRAIRNIDDRFPKGGLTIVDLNADSNQLARDPCLSCLGDRQVLVYFEEAELA